MADNTEENMRRILADTHLAAARAAVLAKVAAKAGRAGMARLLRALALAQEAQARRILALARGKLAGLDEELHALARAKAHDDIARLASWQEQASVESRATEAALFGQLLQASRNHAAMLTEPDAETGSLYVCQICGYITPEAPENCPICKAVRERFEKVE